MKTFHFLFFILLFLNCQAQPSVAQSSGKIKTFDSPYGKAIADFSKKDTFLLAVQLDNVLDTIIFWTPIGSDLRDVLDVKIYDGKIIVIMASYIFIDLRAYKKIDRKWKYIGMNQLINIDEPHDRNKPKQTIVHKNENNVQVFQGSKLIRECIIDYDKSTCQIIEYTKD